MTESRRGFALLAVLWAVTAFGTLSFAMASAARDAVATARNRIAQRQAEWIAEGCAATARSVLAVRVARWPHLDRALATHPSHCHVDLMPSGTAVDVNTASRVQLVRLFHAVGSRGAAVDSLVDAVLDWRDADDLPREFGAESGWYRALQRPAPRNGPIVHAREIPRVRGLAENAVLTYVGVESAPITLTHAPRPVLLSLPGFTEELVWRIEQRRRSGAAIDLAALADILSPAARDSLSAYFDVVAPMVTEIPQRWILTTTARSGDPAVTATVEYVLARAGDRVVVVRRRTW